MTECLTSCIDKGIRLKVEGNYDEALAILKGVIVEDPCSCEAHYQIGLVYGFTGLFDESLNELQCALNLDPARTDVRNDLALTYSMLGLNDEAKLQFEDVLRREPDNEKALKNIVFFQDAS